MKLKILGYMAALGIVGLGARQAWAVCSCSPVHHCNTTTGTGVFTNLCANKADTIAGNTNPGVWGVGISVKNGGGSTCIQNGLIAGTIGGAPVAGCGAEDTNYTDGMSATDTTGCTSITGAAIQVNYCI